MCCKHKQFNLWYVGCYVSGVISSIQLRFRSGLGQCITLLLLTLCIAANSRAATVERSAALQGSDLNIYSYHNPFNPSGLNHDSDREASAPDGAIVRDSLWALFLACSLSALALGVIVRFEYLRYRLSRQPVGLGRICDVFVVKAEDNVPKQDVVVNFAPSTKSKRPTCVATQTVLCQSRRRTTLSPNRLRRFR